VLIRVELLEKYDGGNNLFHVKRRIEAISGEPCLLIHHTQATLELIEGLRPRAIVMSGFGTSFQDFDVREFWPLDDLVKNADVPIIGFCGSHQLIAFMYDLDLRRVEHLRDEPMRRLRPGEPDLSESHPGYFKEIGYYPVEIVKDDPIFEGLKSPIIVRQSHYCEVKKLPEEFELLATGGECRIQAMRHRERLIYTTQFHPEGYTERYPDGKIIIRNFLRIAGVIR